MPRLATRKNMFLYSLANAIRSFGGKTQEGDILLQNSGSGNYHVLDASTKRIIAGPYKMQDINGFNRVLTDAAQLAVNQVETGSLTGDSSA